MTGVALYHLAGEYQQLAERLSNMDLDAQTIADTIEGTGLTEAIAEKAMGVEMVARTMEMHVPAIDAELDRLTKLKKQRQAAAAGLREYLKVNMIAASIDKIEGPLFKIRLQSNPAAVDVFEADTVPERFWVQPETPPKTLDKKAIKKAIDAGEEVPGARLVQGKNLRVS
jgi:hypothetical protein